MSSLHRRHNKRQLTRDQTSELLISFNVYHDGVGKLQKLWQVFETTFRAAVGVVVVNVVAAVIVIVVVVVVVVVVDVAAADAFSNFQDVIARDKKLKL